MRTWEPDRLARAALAAAVGGGDPKLASLVATEGAEAVWQALRSSMAERPWVRRARVTDPDALVDATRAHGLRFIVPGDEEWPSSLEDLDDVEWQGMGGVPLGLWVRARRPLDELARHSVAIVGSRAASAYGERIASDLAVEVADLHGGGRTIISGGAYGIDAAAHRGALAIEASTVAVLACGLDACYPAGNRQIFETVPAKGALVSELPPGATPTKPGFLARNRLIAALSQGVVLVEAALRSGAVNTVGWALELGRPVMAVPGPVTSSLSMSPHTMIRDQRATLVMDASQVRECLDGLDPQRADRARTLHARMLARPTDDLDEVQLAVREALPAREALPIDEIVTRTGRSAPECLAALAQLQDWGLVERRDGGAWGLRRPG